MKGKFKKMMVVMVAVMMTVLNLVSSSSNAYAAVTGIEITETMKEQELTLIPGETKHMKVPIRARGAAINDPSIVLTPIGRGDTEASDLILSNPKLVMADLGTMSYLSNYGTSYVEFDITVKETAKIGSYSIKIEVSGRDSGSGEDVGGTGTWSVELKNLQIYRALSPAQIILNDVAVTDASIGGEAKVSFVLKNEGEITARNTYYSVAFSDKDLVHKSSVKKIKLGEIPSGSVKYIEIPVGILSTAKPELKTVTVTFSYQDINGKEGSDSHEIYVDVKKDGSAPELVIDQISYNKTLEPGAKVNLNAVIKNAGSFTAENLTIKMDDATNSDDGFYKDYITESIYVGSVKADKTIKASIPMYVSKKATGGRKKVNLILDYEDENGNPYTSTITIYPEVIGGSVTDESPLVLNNVTQSPESPAAGDSMQVSFELQNKSQSDITEIKLALQGLDGTTFIPKNSEPYIYVDKIEAGKTKKISIPLTISDSIPEGMSNLTVKYTYAGNPAGETVMIPVRNIQNDLGSNSMPKLIISKYTADVEELRAGSTFNFTFDIYNTNSSVSAKNITVTLKQAESIFSVTQGSNSFFINKIAPGETVQQTVEMKVKSDASTKAYELEVIIEYEYDGIKPNPETGVIGQTRTEKLNLQVVENSRPVVDYVNVYSWDGNVTLGNPATLSFEFYNMGKSPLNNVIATVDGDFTKSDGNMFFLGNVAAGSSSYAEFDVIPNMEGTAKGVLHISFEDSNGDKIEFTKDFETQVMSATTFEPGMPGGDIDVFNPEVPVAKKEIIPVWLFVIIQIVIFAAFIPITRKIVISVYKARLRKQEQNGN